MNLVGFHRSNSASQHANHHAESQQCQHEGRPEKYSVIHIKDSVKDVLNHNPWMLWCYKLMRFEDAKSAIDKRIPPLVYRWLDSLSPLSTEMVGSAHPTTQS